MICVGADRGTTPTSEFVGERAVRRRAHRVVGITTSVHQPVVFVLFTIETLFVIIFYNVRQRLDECIETSQDYWNKLDVQ